MDTDVAKLIFPVVGGTLALAGGVFTFISGRLRDAEGRQAKDRITQLSILWIATILWVIGSVLGAIRGVQIYAVPLYAISFALHWKLFNEGPSPPSRKAVGMFSVFTAVTAIAIILAIMFDLLDRIVVIQQENAKILERTVGSLERIVGSSKLPKN